MVTFKLDTEDLKFVDRRNQWIAEPGVFSTRIGDQHQIFTLQPVDKKGSR